jgi:hypothetical protein
MIADVTGRLLPSSLLVRRLTAADGPVEAVIEFDPRLGEHHQPPRVEHRGDVVVGSWSTTALALRASPPLHLDAGRPLTVRVAPGQPVTLALSLADREPLIYVPPRWPGRHLRPTNTAGRAGVPTSTATSPTATRWPAACSPCGC